LRGAVRGEMTLSHDYKLPNIGRGGRRVRALQKYVSMPVSKRERGYKKIFLTWVKVLK